MEFGDFRAEWKPWRGDSSRVRQRMKGLNVEYKND